MALTYLEMLISQAKKTVLFISGPTAKLNKNTPINDQFIHFSKHRQNHKRPVIGHFIFRTIFMEGYLPGSFSKPRGSFYFSLLS